MARQQAPICNTISGEFLGPSASWRWFTIDERAPSELNDDNVEQLLGMGRRQGWSFLGADWLAVPQCYTFDFTEAQNLQS